MSASNSRQYCDLERWSWPTFSQDLFVLAVIGERSMAFSCLVLTPSLSEQRFL
jgi:hypothetical protein